MVLGYHLVFGAYGFWLPNDPRGSGSKTVWAEHLRRFGPATGLDDRSRSVAGKQHDWRLRLAAKGNLKYPAVKFTGIQAKAIGDGFGDYVRKEQITVWACSILPVHVHLVIGRHSSYPIEYISERLKLAATQQLVRQGLHPFAHLRTAGGALPTCWQRKAWHPFLDTVEDVRHRIQYVEHNPIKEGKPRQRWSFVVPYSG
jgi:REP element-mobilizing transposase RayT